MIIDCYIFSDSVAHFSTLKEFIDKTINLHFSGHSADHITAINEIADTHPAITFLNIVSDDVKALQTIELIGSHTSVVFITEAEDIALRLYRRFAMDFMVAPISYAGFFKIVAKFRHLLEQWTPRPSFPDAGSFYVAEDKGKLIRIFHKDILFIQGAQNYIRIQLTDKQHVIYLSLKEMERGLPADHFIRVHKSYIVNINNIIAIEWNKILFQRGASVMMGEKYRQQLMSIIHRSTIKIKKEGGEMD